ncbi:MAG: hypothetical protein WAJ85_00940 [Candidatus Baltobacteraceae bacterium]|jgi:hypothetical protein
MARLLSAILALAFAASLGSVASAKQCRDAKTGKFVKCPTPKATPMGSMKMSSPKHCKDPKTGKFVKCSK